ncbi:MAG: hypothetical protein JST92_02095, partial [Deltaproteobacteria bacterium]|nr:hypothetical protein [Deltaproteobacteria bacterium]
PRKKYAPLPPIPTIEPEAPKPAKGKKEPYQSEPEHYGPTPLNMEPAPLPPKRVEPGQPQGQPAQPSWQAPPQPPSQGTRAVVPMDERPARTDDRSRPDDRPRPAEPAQVLTPIDERPVAGSEPESESPDKLRRLSVALLGGVWGVGVADGTGRTWEFAKGGRAGYQLFRPLLVDLTVLHASATSGNAFANASDGHLEVLLRAHYLYTRSIVTLGAGLGAGGSFAMTTYLLTPPGANPSTLSANALKLVAEGGVLMWVRPWRGLTVELEVNELLRDGRLEPLLTLGLGWAF